MRRVLLVLSVISFAGWSQPAQPQAQAPIVVQIQTPPANPWMRVVELVIPGIIGAGLALFGVWLTNRYNAATNRANQQHDLEKLNREHSFALKRDVLLRVTQLLVQAIAALRSWDGYRMASEYFERQGDVNDEADKAQTKAWMEYSAKVTDLAQATATACLAVPDELWKAARAVEQLIGDAQAQLNLRTSERTTTLERVDEDLLRFVQAARKELGIVPINA